MKDNIRSLLSDINAELAVVKKTYESIDSLRKELNKFNPFKEGMRINCNSKFSHAGSLFEVENVFVSSRSSDVFRSDPLNPPKYFIASGRNVKKNGTLGSYVVRRHVKIEDVLNNPNFNPFTDDED